MHKVVIITGTSRGIGAHTALLFAEHGYAVCINYIANEGAANGVKNQILQNGGRCIVNVSSLASRTGSPHEYIDYAASKGAVDTLTRGLALEVAAEGVRVNADRPALIYTDMHAAGGEPHRVERLQHKIPMGRGGDPREVAQAIFWLASEESTFVTGSFIDVAGGL